MNTLAANLVNPALGTNLQTLNGVTFTQRLVPVLILLVLTIGVIIFIFNLLLGGVAYINSGGDKGKAEAARSKITHAVIGIVVMFAVYMAISLMGAIFGMDFFILDLGSLQI